MGQKMLSDPTKEGSISHLLPGYGNGTQDFPIKEVVLFKIIVGNIGYIFCTRKPPQLIHYREFQSLEVEGKKQLSKLLTLELAMLTEYL